MTDLVEQAEAISRFSEAGQAERIVPQQKPKGVSFGDIPAQAFKEGSVYRDVVSNKFNPATDNISDAVSGKSPKSKRQAGGAKQSNATAAGGAYKASKDAPPEEKKRLALIKQVNYYVSNQLIVNRLAKKGIHLALLPSNVSLEQAEDVMETINEALSGDVSKNLVIQGVSALNVMTESAVPILKKQNAQDIGLSEGFMFAIKNPETDMALSMEELSIMMRPYLPVAGALTRFVYNYSKMCMELAYIKQQRQAPQEEEEYYDDSTPVGDEEAVPQ